MRGARWWSRMGRMRREARTGDERWTGTPDETMDGSRHKRERDERDGFRERSGAARSRVHAASVSSDALMPLRNRARAEEKKPCTMAPLIRPITSMVLA